MRLFLGEGGVENGWEEWEGACFNSYHFALCTVLQI